MVGTTAAGRRYAYVVGAGGGHCWVRYSGHGAIEVRYSGLRIPCFRDLVDGMGFYLLLLRALAVTMFLMFNGVLVLCRFARCRMAVHTVNHLHTGKQVGWDSFAVILSATYCRVWSGRDMLLVWVPGRYAVLEWWSDFLVGAWCAVRWAGCVSWSWLEVWATTLCFVLWLYVWH